MMYAMECKQWITFLVVGIMIVLAFKILSTQDNNVESYRENFSIPPTYTAGSCPMTTIPPIHAEEWQSPPPIYDEYTHVASENECGDYVEDRPIYGQYITANSLMPYQSQETSTRTLDDAKLYMNDEFTNDTLQFRNDMTRLYVNKLDKWYRHGCYDQISPYNSC